MISLTSITSARADSHDNLMPEGAGVAVASGDSLQHVLAEATQLPTDPSGPLGRLAQLLPTPVYNRVYDLSPENRRERAAETAVRPDTSAPKPVLAEQTRPADALARGALSETHNARDRRWLQQRDMSGDAARRADAEPAAVATIDAAATPQAVQRAKSMREDGQTGRD